MRIQRSLVGYKFGYIDTTGKPVIPAIFDEVFPFENGVARVRVGTGYGYIDPQGAFIQKPICGKYDSRYESFYVCTEEGGMYARNWKGKNIVDEPLTWIKEADQGLVALREGSQRATYFSLNGKILFEADEIGYWSDGRAPFRESGGWGYIKEDGSILIPAKYDRADRFSNGYGYVSSGCRNYTVSTSGELSLADPRPRASVMECGPKTNLQYCEGRIDDPISVKCEKATVEDQPALKCKHSDGAFTVQGADWVSAFQKGLGFARVPKTKKFGVINLKGEWLTSKDINRFGYFDGCYAYLEINYMPFTLDERGLIERIEENSPENQWHHGRDVGEGVRCFETFEPEGRFYCYSDDFRPHPQRYSEIGEYSEGLMPASLEYGKSGFVDRKGKFSIRPTYLDARQFSEGLASVRVQLPGKANTSEGYINRKGELVIAPNFFWARPFSEGLALVTDADADQRFYIDRTGKPAFPGRFQEAQDFSEGLAGVAVGTKWGFRDASGKVLFGRQYDYGWYISEDKVSYCDEGLCGYLDRTGEIIIPARFCAVREFHEGLAAAAIQCSEDANGNLRAVWGYIDVSGEFALAPSPVFTGLPFRDGVVIAKKGEKFGLLEHHGFKGLLQLDRFKGIKYGFLDSNGAEVIPAIYDSARPFRADRSGECSADVSVGLKFFQIGIDGDERERSK